MINLNHSRNLAVRPRVGCFHVLFLLPVLIAGLSLMLAGRVTAQTFTTLHSFTGGSDGSQAGGLITNSSGTARFGGNGGSGTVFTVNTDGTGFMSLYSFTATSPSFPYTNPYTNSDGANPQAGLLLSGNTLYGTAEYGGSWDNGTVFAINADGTGFTNLHSFTSTNASYPYRDGAHPQAGLVLSGNTLWDGKICWQWGQRHRIRRQH